MKGFTPWPGMVSYTTYAAVDSDVAVAAAAVFVFDCTFFMQQRGSGVAAYVAASATAAAAVAVTVDVKTHSHALNVCCKQSVRMLLCMRQWVGVCVSGVGSAALLTTAGVEYLLTLNSLVLFYVRGIE